jgi:hypothetical protein
MHCNEERRTDAQHRAAKVACKLARLGQCHVREERRKSEARGDARERKPRQAAAERFEQHEAGNDQTRVRDG